MLTRLYIRNIALIQASELSLQKGLTVVTGETGAGKSMLMDSLSLCVGERADTSLIRHGAEDALVEASFENFASDHPLHALLAELGIPLDEGELTLRRMLTGGKSKAFANGMRLTRSQLQSLGDYLADIHGQHDHQMLLKSGKHIEILDHFGTLQAEVAEVKSTYKTWKNLQNRLDSLDEERENRAREETLLTAYVQEFEEMNYSTGEEESLASERTRLMSVENILTALASSQQVLGENGVVDGVGQAARNIQSVSEHAGKEAQDLADRLESLYAELADVQQELGLLSARTEPDPLMLEQVDNRLQALRDLARKHRVDVPELTRIHQEFVQRLEDLALIQEDAGDLEKQITTARNAFEDVCRKLSKKRHKAAEQLEASIHNALADLEMPHTRFEVALGVLQPQDWGVTGAEEVEFMVSTNPGSPLQALVKVASGGEVSRLMLALKSVFYAALPPMTVVFDEIDTGVGGATADAVGRALKKLAEKHQVLAITHQPQVASKGQVHVKIEKHVENNDTHTTVTVLNDLQRQEELARMLSGKDVTDAAREAAQSLLAGAA